MKLSVIVPVLDEAETLAGALACLRAGIGQEAVELLVVDGGSADDSVAVARRFADKVLPSRPGRAAQLHHGALQAKGDVLLFLHADTFLPEGWHAALTRVWDGPRPPAAAAFRLGFDADGWRYRLIERSARLRTALTGVPLGDQAISTRHDVYRAVGGFPDVPLMEEYYLLRKLRRRGPVAVIDRPVRTSARRFERHGPIRNSLRNTLITALFYCGVPPRSLARLYR